ncbi:MAG TPA: ATPase domain-containing protein [Pyrinomonadaceae bacterium]|nr:ATPase domain-containing protein [Pyrinomonadaceae bacterium]
MSLSDSHLRFGIPSLDALFGDRVGERGGMGIRLPAGGDGSNDPQSSSVSLCISGPDGTGKSILGLHLASRYAADCLQAGAAGQKILYISTDLKFGMAYKVWRDFALDWPDLRTVPFETQGEKVKRFVKLTACSPLKGARGGDPLSKHLSAPPREQSGGEVAQTEVYFVDLATATVGDDWGFINRVLSVLERPKTDEPRHLVVIDSVEGFETLVGERDAFGVVRERRSRIAQIMRSAGDKCHTLLVVEEPREGERLPEEFVTDVVVRLRSVMVRDYVRRTVEIEKARGHAHVRGQHAYLIRSGAGATTGQRENPDDPFIKNIDDGKRPGDDRRPDHQSYLHVCHSLHHSYRKAMTAGRSRPPEPSKNYAAFGIRYLDDMLEKAGDDFRRRDGDDQRGLRCSTTTALIGNPETQKGPLGVAFLSRCFREYAARFSETLVQFMEGGPAPDAALLDFLSSAAAPGARGESEAEARRRLVKGMEESARREGLYAGWVPDNVARHCQALYRMSRARLDDDSGLGAYLEGAEAERRGGGRGIDPRVRAAAWAVGPPRHADDGLPVLLTTQDVDAQKLVREFLPWLIRKVPKLKKYEAEGSLAALRVLMEQYTICRRLEIHDLPSAVLIHILQRTIDEARNILHGEEPSEAATPAERARRSWGIRVVIDDFSILKDTYIEIREESLLSRFIVFHLGQEGVTTLLIDTQPGRPDTAVASPLHSELRSLVDNRIYTWRFPFHGEDRVAIAVIPPISGDTPAYIRELRRGVKSATGPESLPLVVDPHFELYSGIERGEPSPIQLEVWLFEETPAFKTYIDEENVRYGTLFMPLWESQPGGTGRVLVGVPCVNYDEYRDVCYLQRDTRLDHTLIFQVDEFWVMPTSPGLRRAGTFRPQWKYLNATTGEESEEETAPGEKWKREWAADPFRLFQRTKAGAQRPEEEWAGHGEDKKRRRRYEFVYHGYQTELGGRLEEQLAAMTPTEVQQLKESIDRVPFMWDFGFLLCKVRAWEEAAEIKLEIWNEAPRSGFMTVGDVWAGLPKGVNGWGGADGPRPSWRAFLEACYQLSRQQAYSGMGPVTAFDIHGASSQTLSSLVLEIWASEIYDRVPARRAELKTQVTERPWRSYIRTGGLIDWLTNYRQELFRVWLMLVEVIDLNVLARSVEAGTLRALEPNPTAVTVRHWYKTACQVTENLSADDAVVPVGLPGHFSVRGDWFLAASGGSRSGRLADRALDLLTSRRANHTRLQKGLGLPTRRLDGPGLPTSILTLDFSPHRDPSRNEVPRRISRVKYDNLMKIGGDTAGGPPDFHWFWRSGLFNYHRHTRVWQNWLEQMILWWDRMRYVYRDDWMNGFKRYDQLDGGESVKAWDRFNERCNRLIKELREATLD